MNQYQIDVVPTPHMLFVEQYDRPGVVGFLASVLGEDNVNIAMMQVARKTKDEEAMMVLNIDSPAEEGTLTKLRNSGKLVSVKVVNM
jgi:D-3-phosphoglycerate dehydrogenase